MLGHEVTLQNNLRMRDRSILSSGRISHYNTENYFGEDINFSLRVYVKSFSPTIAKVNLWQNMSKMVSNINKTWIWSRWKHGFVERSNYSCLPEITEESKWGVLAFYEMNDTWSSKYLSRKYMRSAYFLWKEWYMKFKIPFSKIQYV